MARSSCTPGGSRSFASGPGRLAAAFPEDVDFVVTNAAGCGSAMRDYGHWLPDSPAARLAARIRDVTEVLVDAELPLGAAATHRDLPRRLSPGPRPAACAARRARCSQRIPGLRLVELPDSDLCCGSAGVYNLLEPEMADRLLDLKLARIAETGARVVAAGNPGCLLQIAKGARAARPRPRGRPPGELLARAAKVSAP